MKTKQVDWKSVIAKNSPDKAMSEFQYPRRKPDKGSPSQSKMWRV